MSDFSKDEVQKCFGAVLREARHDAELSQEELAHQAGLDRSYVGSVERGERNVSLFNIVRLSRAINIPPAELFDAMHSSHFDK